MPPTNGQPPQSGEPRPTPTVPQPRAVQTHGETRQRIPPLHPEAENLAYGYSDLLMELDRANIRINALLRELEQQRRERAYWKRFVHLVTKTGTKMLDGEDVS